MADENEGKTVKQTDFTQLTYRTSCGGFLTPYLVLFLLPVKYENSCNTLENVL